MAGEFNIKKISTDDLRRTTEPVLKDVKKGTQNSAAGNKDMKLRKERKINNKWVKIALTTLFVIVLIVGAMAGAIAISAQAIKKQATVTLQVGRETASAAKNQDLELTAKKLTELESSLQDLDKSYDSLSWTRAIPALGAYYKDGERGLTAAMEFVKAGKIAVAEITPYADLLGLTEGDSSFVNQPADERIKMAVSTFDKVTPKLGEIAEHLARAQEEIDQIDPDRYPEKIGDKEVRTQLVQGKELLNDTVGLFVNAQPLLEIVPDLLGNEEKKTYLLIFQNDKELRSTGGFMTAYAVLEFDEGKMRVVSSEDIYRLDERQTKTRKAPEEILAYHKGVYNAYIRDSNLSPDFYESMKMFEELYDTVSGKVEYDGIIALDTHVLVSTIDVLDGDIFVPEYGAHFTTEPDDRCDGCPQVIYELEDYADRPVGYAKGARKDILGRLMFALMQKALGVSPSVYWGPLTQTLFDEINEKHILIYLVDDEQQSAIEALNYAGRIKDYDGDYLHINDTNFAGAKSNMFVKHFVKQEIDVGDDGTVTKTITIDYKNSSPPSNCNLESGELCLNGLLRNWLRIYVPKGSELVEFKGAGSDTITKEDLGKTVFEGFLTVEPMGSSQVILTYKLPFKVNDEYKMLIQKQPGTEGHEYKTILNGKEVDAFNLTQDQEFTYSL